MVTFRNNNNNRRPPFRGSNGGSKFSNNDNFQRKVPGRNNHNAPKLIEKYNEMAREALANEDRVLSENYFQHADHFTRVQNEQESNKISRVNSSPIGTVNPIKTETVTPVKKEELSEVASKVEIKKVIKTTEKKLIEKKSATS